MIRPSIGAMRAARALPVQLESRAIEVECARVIDRECLRACHTALLNIHEWAANTHDDTPGNTMEAIRQEARAALARI
jgi:hypothetical protein